VSWEQRRTQHYYYRSRKIRGRIIRQYYGRGNQAERAATEDAERRAEHERERTERQHIQALNTETTTLYQHATTLVKAVYLIEGYHQHHRSEWRKRRTHITQEGDSMNTTTLVVQENLSIDTLTSLIHQAMSGDESTLPAIQTLLDQAPAIWQETFSITKRIERAWIDTIASQDLLTREVLTRQLAALKMTLEAESSSLLESLIIETICTCFLAYKHAELSAATQLQRYGNALTQAQQNHLTACQKRYLSAMRELARIRQLLLAPRTTTVLNIASQ